MGSRLILGSQSPRRKELMLQAGFDFEVISPDIDECYDEGMDVHVVPEYLAKLKNKAVRGMVNDHSAIVITADTVVVLDNKIIGKPVDPSDAKVILAKLSGKMHEVVSGVCISKGDKTVVFSDLTKVYFNILTGEEISYFVDHYHPLDKAGAYAIQEWIGLIGVNRIEGCFFNVMGLPVPKVYEVLKKFSGTID